MYKVKNLLDCPTEGTFYAEELQKVTKPDVFRVNNVLEKKRKNRKVLYKIRWTGYLSDFDAWITERELKLSRLKRILKHSGLIYPLLLADAFKAGKFKVELPITIQLDHGLEWELALKEMFWPSHGDFIDPASLWMEIRWPRSLKKPYEYLTLPSESLVDFGTVISLLQDKFKNFVKITFDGVLEIILVLPEKVFSCNYPILWHCYLESI